MEFTGKRIFTAFTRVMLVMMMALGLSSAMIPAQAANTASGSCGSGLKWTLSDEGVLAVTGSGAMDNYSDPRNSTAVSPWYANRGLIRTVNIADTVTNVGDYAFSDCQNLTRISLGGGLTRIGKGAFELCDVLSAVTVPAKVTVIEDGAFSGCTNLANVTLPEGLAKIGNYAFSVCENLQYIQIPQGVAAIGEYAFTDCYALKTVSIPDSVASIGRYAFMRCKALTQVVIPHSVVSLGDYSFMYCPELKEVSMTNGIETIGRYAFGECDALATVYFEGTEADWDAISIHTGNTDLTNAKIEFIEPAIVNPDSISLATSGTVEVGASNVIGVMFSPSNTTEKALSWTTSDSSTVTVDANGKITGRKVGTATVTATTSNGKKASVNISVLFTDVPQSGVYYAKAVYWAYGKGITYGYTDADGLARTFGPEKDCTRAQMVTFLWRMAGKPNPKSMNSSFSDVKDRSLYYYKAVLWAAEKGITSGYNDGTFKPDATCLREHAVTFLWRYAGKPSVNSTVSFKDVKSSDYYYKAVLWAAKKGITNGYSEDNTFRPKNSCLREHIVTFMYRY